MTAWKFDTETAIDPTSPSGSPASSARFDTEISSAWNIGDNPNGGYLLSPVLRAMRQLAPAHQDPVSITTHYLRPGSGDTPGVVDAEILRPGRTLTTVRGSLTQDGKTRISTVASLGDLGAPGVDAAGVHELALSPPDLDPPEECLLRSGVEQGIDLPILNRLEVRIPQEYAIAGASDTAEIKGWIRFDDGRPVDTAALPLFADAFPPALFTRFGYIGWVPTIELTVHVRRRPVAGWIRGHFRCIDLADGRFIEDGALWDESGALVAHSRQVGMLLIQPEPAGHGERRLPSHTKSVH